MKNDLYRRFQHRLTLLFLLCTLIITCILLFVIALISYRGAYLASVGALKESDFLYFYRQHSWEMNTFLFAGAFALLLYMFVSAFFRSMDALMQFMEGKKLKRYPLFFRLVPQFEEIRGELERMQKKRDSSRELSEKEREHKNDLLMYLAHDLKTPLTSMIGYINHILDHHLEKKQEEEAMQIAYTKANRLDALLDEFSEMLRYDDKANRLSCTMLDLSSLLQQQVTGFYPLMEQKKIVLQTEIEQELMIEGDYDKLQRVFDNLLRNAINYCPLGSMIFISAQGKQEELFLRFCNASEGLDAHSVEHLFDKFYRASAARTSSSGGAGLGLAIAKEIIQLHHGSIEAHLQEDVIHFTIRLPIRQEKFL